MIDLPTLKTWIDKLGFRSEPEGPAVLRLHPPPSAAPLPPFYVQLGAHWVLLSMLPMLRPAESRLPGMSLRLLAENRTMCVAKFARDEAGAVVLCAELPTESLDESEVADAVERIAAYARSFREHVGLTPG